MKDKGKSLELGAVSSVVEHYLDTVGVTGSIPVAPTTPAGFSQRYQAFGAAPKHRPARPQGRSLENTTVPLALNMPPTPWQTEIFAPGTCAGAVPRICRTLSCRANMPYMPVWV